MKGQETIPAAVRMAVRERDGDCCRVCGAHVENPALHHIAYRSEGGLHVVENLVTVHWMFEPRCHERVHSNKALWKPLLQAVIAMDGWVTAMQVLRWARHSRPEYLRQVADV